MSVSARWLPPSLLLLLLLLPESSQAKKRKIGFLKSEEARGRYVDYVFKTYDARNDGLDESEVDTANDEEPPVRVKKGYEDALEVFDIDLLDKDPQDGRVTKSELLTKLRAVETRRLEVLAGWDQGEQQFEELMQDFEDLHEVSATPVNELIIVNGRSRITVQRREKISKANKEKILEKYKDTYTVDKIQKTWEKFVMEGHSKKVDHDAHFDEEGNPIAKGDAEAAGTDDAAGASGGEGGAMKADL
eukprot:COSAG05_NODE_5883_length_1066_cov_1.844635_1_plen_246_part_00